MEINKPNNMLSSEILITTFSYLRDPTDFLACAKTCSTWKNIIDSRELWNIVIRRKWPLAPIEVIADSKRFYLSRLQKVLSFTNVPKSKMFSHRLPKRDNDDVLEGEFVKDSTSLKIMLLTKTFILKGSLELVRKTRDSKVLSLKDKEELPLLEDEHQRHLISGSLESVYFVDSTLFLGDGSTISNVSTIIQATKDFIILRMSNLNTFLIKDGAKDYTYEIDLPEDGTFLAFHQGNIFYSQNSKIHRISKADSSSLEIAVQHLKISKGYPLSSDYLLLELEHERELENENEIETTDNQTHSHILCCFASKQQEHITIKGGGKIDKIESNATITLIKSASYLYSFNGNDFKEYIDLKDGIVDFVLDDTCLITIAPKHLLIRDLLSPNVALSSVQMPHTLSNASSILCHSNNIVLLKVSTNHIMLLSLTGSSLLPQVPPPTPQTPKTPQTPSQPIPIGTGQASSPYNNVVIVGSAGGGGGSWKCSSKSLLEDALREWEEDEEEEEREREEEERLQNDYQMVDLTEEEMIEYASMLSMEDL